MKLFRSGVAARLSGIPVQTLRVWERRYQLTGVKPPGSHQRLYTQAEVERLTAIKRLVDLGQSIGPLVAMDLDSLQSIYASLERLQAGLGEAESAVLSGRVHVGFAGMFLETIRPELPPRTAATWSDVRAHSLTALTRVDGFVSDPPDVLLVEFPSIVDSTVQGLLEFVKTYAVSRVMVFYRFAPSALIRSLRTYGFAVMRMPPDEAELSKACRDFLLQCVHRIGLERDSGSPPPSSMSPRYSLETLGKLTSIESSVFCECPRQLAQLLINITAFEGYSAQCANRDSNDVLIHQRLQRDAATVRCLLEDSLDELLRYEGISPDSFPLQRLAGHEAGSL